MTACKKGFWIVMALAGALLVNGAWIHIKAQVAQWLLQDAWQQTQQDGGIHKPWKWADHWPVARLKVPYLQVDQIVLEGDSGNVMAFAPGHNAKSANPGESGVIIFSGHRDTHFSFLQYLKKGQSIQVETAGRQFHYQITDRQIVDATQTVIDTGAAVNHLLLVTCYPFNSPVAGGALRYVVTAKPVL